ncbi:MAG: hypothetical protein K2F92_00660 [Alistipes sp.]|nr:hypothetical protein [Alistipes sp.]
MKRFNFWRSLFVSAMAVMAFAACSDKNDDNGGTGEASITVNGKAAVAIGLTAEAGAQSEAVSIVSSGAWTLEFEPAGTDWCTASAVAGNGGTSTVKFTADALPEGIEERSVTAVVKTSGVIFGVAYDQIAKIKIQQSVSGEVSEIIYKETFGTAQVASNTDVDKYTAWNKTGEGAADVTYMGTNVSIRNTNTNVATSYDGASTAPILFFGKVPATFTVQNITLTAEQTNLQLTFGGQQVITNGSDYTWSNDNLLVALSADGKVWSTIEYTTNDGDQNADGKNWVLATANFTLKAPAEKLYIRFKAPVLASATRIDDITLQTGVGGQEVDLAAGDPVATVKINEITAAGDYQVEGATVIAAYEAGFLMQDETGIILVYPGSDATIPAVGKVVTVRGEVSVYGGALQFGQGALITETGEGTVPATPEAVEITADNIAGFMNSPKITYVKTTGTLTVDDKYRNLVFTFETSYKGSIVAPVADAPFDLTKLSGSLVDVTGWFLNNANGNTYLSILPMEVKENTTTPTLTFASKPSAFAGSNPATQTINFTATNIPADENVTFEFTGDDKAMFDVEGQTNTSVTIKAVGDNNSGAVYNATLVASYNNVTLAQVAVKQNAVSSGNDTKGTFTSMTGMLPTSTDSGAAYYAEKAKINGSDEAVDILKLGTGSKAGAFTTAAVGVTGNKKLSFYAAAWNGKTATLYIKVDNGGAVAPGSVALASNAGVSGSSPYTITFSDDNEYYTVELTDLTAASTITFSTNAEFKGGAEDKSTGRALIAGIQIY